MRSGKWKEEEDSINIEVKKKISNYEWIKKEIFIRIKEINWEEMGMKEGMHDGTDYDIDLSRKDKTYRNK